ncbi:MAG: thiamine-phosphate kinase [Planctomycetota bacterium]
MELELVDWLRKQQRQRPNVALGIGDDMAVLRPISGQILLTSDMLLDGVHFNTQEQALERIGRKAIACSLSDCAAMAATPVAAVVSVALPESMTLSQTKELFGGMLRLADEFELAIVGGDTTRWRNPLVIDVVITATVENGFEPVLRSGAMAGDTIWVSGPLGGSILGRHLSFTPRVREAIELRRSLGSRLHAMMDISDGLSLDLWRMCQESGCGAVLDEAKLDGVTSVDARALSERDGRSALDHVLSDGEDFELLLTIDSSGGADLDQFSIPLFSVGEICESGLSIRRRTGHVEPLEPKGFVH